ncbi:hypothetical protein AAG570_003986 [Ranatra chinensis]|uniref:lysozyme n=1 Tax=Ranatra chinensis TaxID=642074 RepID=A0ABD0Y2I5_9HEMI
MESKGFATLPLAAVILLLCMVTNGSGQQTPVVKIFQLDEVCLGCMCEAVSDCNRSLRCQEGVCGLFRITKPYWMDANRPTVPQDQPTDELGMDIEQQKRLTLLCV